MALTGANFILVRGIFAAPSLIRDLPDGGGPILTAEVVARSVQNQLIIPEADLELVLPAPGINWGRLHPVNAVDIANRCGAPILAAADGIVVEEKSSGWNDGYGNHITLEHKNSIRTRYAHTQKNLFKLGHHVLQGDLIAYVGNTGNTHGPTGCHIHFEVFGQQNPFVDQ